MTPVSHTKKSYFQIFSATIVPKTLETWWWTQVQTREAEQIQFSYTYSRQTYSCETGKG